MGPTASVNGRLIDAVSGKPIADRRVQASIRIELPNRVFQSRWTVSSTTDPEGRFTLHGLAVGWKIELRMSDTLASGQTIIRPIATAGVIPQKEGLVELGDLKVKTRSVASAASKRP